MTNLCFLQKLKFSKVLVAVSIASGFFLSGQTVSAQTTIDNFTDARNDRFSNVPQDPSVPYTDETQSFVLPANLSLSGVGRRNNGGWATLIGDNVVLSADHVRPNVGDTLLFYPGNDPNDSPFQANVVGGSKVGSTDLYVGYLDRVVDSSIARYDFATTFIPGVAAPAGSVNISPNNPFQGDLGYILGNSLTNRSDASIDQSVGLNLVSGYAENVEFFGNTDNDTLVYEFNDPGDGVNGSDYTENEAFVRGGDSGAPNFTVLDDGTLLLLGVNSFQLNGEPVVVIDPLTGEETGTEQFRATGVTYTGNQTDEINRLIAAAPAPTFSAVPEPSSTALLAIFSLLVLKRKRK